MLPPPAKYLYVSPSVMNQVKDDPFLIAYFEQIGERMDNSSAGIINEYFENQRAFKLRIADLPGICLSDKVIKALLDENDPEINKSLVYRQKNLSEDILDYLSENQPEFVKAAVGGHKNTRKETLKKLSNLDSKRVKLSVARNTSADEDTLANLSREKDEAILVAVAKNPSTSEATIKSLSLNRHRRVKEKVIVHPKRNIYCFAHILYDNNIELKKMAEQEVIIFLTDPNKSVLARKGMFQEISILNVLGNYLKSDDKNIRKKARSELMRIFKLAMNQI
jgi:hypothetical protein